MKKFRFWAVAFAIAALTMGWACVPRRTPPLRTHLESAEIEFPSTGGLSCGSFGVGHRPSQGDIDLCKKFLSETDGKVLQILWEEFDEVVSDGVHNGQTCPILVLYPLQKGHEDGSISDEDFAKRLYKFYREKYKQGLDEKAKDKAKKRLKAAGLPIP